MKKFLLPLAALAMLAFCPTVSHAQTYTAENPLVLKLTSFAMSTHPVWIGGFEPWAQEVKAASGGRLIIEPYNANTICPDADVHDCVRNGVIDISGQLSQRVKGTYPLSNIIDLPFLFPSSIVAAHVFKDLLDEFPEFKAEYGETHMLGAWASAPYQLHFRNKEIKTINDLKGLKIGCVAASIVPLLQALGASVVVVPTTDAYVTLQRGQVDGFAAPYAFMVSTKIYEATKYSFTINMSANGMPLTMNKQVYESMPDDLRKVLDDSVAGYTVSQRFASVTDDGADRDKAFIAGKGQTIHAITDADIAKGRQMCAGVVEDWYRDCEKRGKGELARTLYKRAQELSAKYTTAFHSS